MDRLRAGSGDYRVIALASPLAQYRAHAEAIWAAVAGVPATGATPVLLDIAAIRGYDKG